MGTAKDDEGGKGGAWTPYKRAAMSFARHGGEDRAARTLAGLVAVLGGAGGAVARSGGGAAAGQRLGRFMAGTAEGGLAGGLTAVGLGDLVGRSRFEVLTALIDRIAGAGQDPEEQAARSAVLDVLAELLPDGDEFEDLAALELNAEGVREALRLFLVFYIYNRVGSILESRLARLEAPDTAEARDAELRAYIRSIVALRLRDFDPLTVDWDGDEGQELIERTLRSVYRQLEAEDDTDGEDDR